KLAPKAEPPAGASFLDRLRSSAAGLVQVRPVGEPSGETPADLVARIEAAVRRGAFADALRLWERLPETARADSAAWADRLRARLAAEDAARAIQSDAVARLARAKS
ncbi:MAG TPA: hypothetical protein VIL72_14450, partial [Beijerinckiaceae bacterium]